MTWASSGGSASDLATSRSFSYAGAAQLDAWRALGLSAPLLARATATPPEAGWQLGRVVAVQRAQVVVHDGHQARPAEVWPSLQLSLQVQGDGLVVGDWVWCADLGGRVPSVLQRVVPLNRLERREPSGLRRGLVSNVDTALLLMGCGPDLNLRRLDRYLALVRLAGMAPVVVLTQADLHAAPEDRVAAVNAHLRGLALPVLALDGTSAAAAAALQPWLGLGRTLVMLGSSGVGKSTLTNTLIRAASGAGTSQRTGAARAGDGRGRHTTTERSLHRCAGGACLIDTPGLRGLQLDADADAVAAAFDDVQDLAAQCRFRNCRHQGEPGCVVQQAVSPDRLRSFHKLQREAQRLEADWHDRQTQLAAWKARSRQARAALKTRRGD